MMASLYQCDMAYVHSVAFESLACGAAPEIIRRLQFSKAPIQKVMDVGCGAGPLTKALVDAGFDVTGVDTSAELLKLADARVPTARFLNASIHEIEISGYDALIAVGEPLTYHSENVDADSLIGAFFQRAADALPPGGVLVFDVIGLGEPSLAGRTRSSGDDWAVLVETTEDQAARTLTRSIEVFRRVGGAYKRSHEVHRVRLFDPSVLHRQLSSHGFVTETFQCYGSQQLPRRHAFFAIRTG